VEELSRGVIWTGGKLDVEARNQRNSSRGVSAPDILGWGRPCCVVLTTQVFSLRVTYRLWIRTGETESRRLRRAGRARGSISTSTSESDMTESIECSRVSLGASVSSAELVLVETSILGSGTRAGLEGCSVVAAIVDVVVEVEVEAGGLMKSHWSSIAEVI